MQRIDERGIAAETLHGVAHGGEIDDGGHSGEILQQHARRHEGDFVAGGSLGLPGGDRANGVGRDGLAVFATQQVLQQDAQGIRQFGSADALLVERVQAVDLKFAITNTKSRTTSEAIHRPLSAKEILWNPQVARRWKTERITARCRVTFSLRLPRQDQQVEDRSESFRMVGINQNVFRWWQGTSSIDSRDAGTKARTTQRIGG